MPETFENSRQIDAPLMKVFVLGSCVPCLPGAFVLVEKARQGHNRQNSRAVRRDWQEPFSRVLA